MGIIRIQRRATINNPVAIFNISDFLIITSNVTIYNLKLQQTYSKTIAQETFTVIDFLITGMTIDINCLIKMIKMTIIILDLFSQPF